MPTDPILPRPYFDGKVTTIHELIAGDLLQGSNYN